MIEQIVDSNLKTETLEQMYLTNQAMIKNMESIGGEPKELIGWRRKLEVAISIRKAMNDS